MKSLHKVTFYTCSCFDAPSLLDW